MFADVKEDAPEEQSPDIDQQKLELHHIKEESERIWASQDGEQLNVKEETDDTRFPFTVVHMKSEDDKEKSLFPQLHQHQTEDRDLPSSSSGDQIKAEIKEEDCGTAESSRDPDLNTHGGSSNYSETKDREDDEEHDDVKHHESELKRLSDSETEDSEDDWKESRVPGLLSDIYGDFGRLPTPTRGAFRSGAETKDAVQKTRRAKREQSESDG
ncbi:hypothetical protein CRENBAI_011783 [Crenichthys baileyi]|uniref:Uncharacterized protein n=1 Tax=Crenichthys baileyi TaxID=28760 RepID=A0AAV9RYS7_9TELE